MLLNKVCFGEGLALMKSAFVFMGVIIFLFTNILPFGDNNENRIQLFDLLDVMENRKIDVEEWALYTSGVVGEIENESELEDKLNEWNALVGNMEWQESEQENNGHQKMRGQRKHESLPFVEHWTITTYPSRNNHHLYLIYEIKGTNSPNIEKEELFAFVKKRENDLFQQKQEWFSMAKGVSKHISEDLVDEGEKLMSLLSANKVEALKEETFVSISAYNEKWVQSLETNGKQMNVQIALRQGSRLGSFTTVTIGTPIITTEY